MDIAVIAIIVAIVAGIVSLVSAFIAWQQAQRVKRIETTTQERLAQLTADTQGRIEQIVAQLTADTQGRTERVVAQLTADTQERIEQIVAQRMADTQGRIEQMQADNERLNQAFVAASNEAAPLGPALSQMWQSFQSVKDEVRRLYEVEQGTVEHVNTAREAIHAVQSRLQNMDRADGGQLPDTVRRAGHEGEHIMNSILFTLERAAQEVQETGRLSPETVRDLYGYCDRLTTLQDILAIERNNLRGHQLHRLLEMMAHEGTHANEVQGGMDEFHPSA